jgi:hypothetical protein
MTIVPGFLFSTPTTPGLHGMDADFPNRSTLADGQKKMPLRKKVPFSKHAMILTARIRCSRTTNLFLTSQPQSVLKGK